MAQRQIKFRVWNKRTRQLNRVTALEWSGSGMSFQYMTVDDGENLRSEVKYGDLSSTNIILEQYTGRKDYKGVDIYEGDSVLFSVFGVADKGIVQFSENGTWIINNIKTSPETSYWIVGAVIFNQVMNVEVIGNIHENPELLEAE